MTVYDTARTDLNLVGLSEKPAATSYL